MTINEISKLDPNDIYYFCTGNKTNDLKLFRMNKIEVWFKSLKCTILINNGEIYIDSTDNSRGIVCRKDISEYLIYLRDIKLNALLDDN